MPAVRRSAPRARQQCCKARRGVEFWTSCSLHHDVASAALLCSSWGADRQDTRAGLAGDGACVLGSSAMLLCFAEGWNCQPSVKIATPNRPPLDRTESV